MNLTYDNVPATGFVVISNEQMEKCREASQVLRFVQAVNEAAIKRPEWKTHYTLALYKAFGEEADKELLATLTKLK